MLHGTCSRAYRFSSGGGGGGGLGVRLHVAWLKRPLRFCRGWKLNNLTSVIHYSLGVSYNYSLYFLSSCWLFINHNRFRVQRIALAKFRFNYNTFGNNTTQLIFIRCYSVLLAIGSTI